MTPASSSSNGSGGDDNASLLRRVAVHVEARLAEACVCPRQEVKARVEAYLAQHVKVFRLGPLGDYAAADPFLGQALASLTVSELGGPTGEETAVSTWRAAVLVHVYRLAENPHPGGVDFALTEEASAPAAFTAHVCPCRELAGLWESIHVEHQTKRVLLALAETSMLFSLKRVDSNLVAGNKVILLHGEPGTGKTSLARGLAQKLAIRHADSFRDVELLSVNAHALISKFFGESSALVGRVFASIRERVALGEEEAEEDEDEEDGGEGGPRRTLFILSIDEVETVCGSRQAALARGSNEPSDAVRVVNAVLTEIDRLRAFPNVLVVCTSNVTGALDAAFMDRCDLKLHVGLPSAEGRFTILRSALLELMRVGIVGPRAHVAERFEHLSLLASSSSSTSAYAASSTSSQALARIVDRSEGLSGRALRKLPLQAHALLLGGARMGQAVPLAEFLKAMEAAVDAIKIAQATTMLGAVALGGERDEARMSSN